MIIGILSAGGSRRSRTLRTQRGGRYAGHARAQVAALVGANSLKRIFARQRKGSSNVIWKCDSKVGCSWRRPRGSGEA